MALTFGGSTYPWNSGRQIALWVVFGVLLIAFFIQQYTCLFIDCKRRIFPAQFLKRRTLVLCFICTKCAATAFFVIVYFLPIYFQFVHNDTGLESAIRLLPVIICSLVHSIVGGTTMPYVGYCFPFYVVAGVPNAIGGVVHSLAISAVILQDYAFLYVSTAVKDLHLSAEEIRSAITGTNSAVFDMMAPEQ